MSILDLVGLLNAIVSNIVKLAILIVVVLMIARLVVELADLNPFGRPARLVRQATDSIIFPVRRAVAHFGFGAKAAPVIAILIAVLLGYLLLQLTTAILGTLAGVVVAANAAAPVRLIGHILYGALSVYGLLIFARIIFMWGNLSYANRVMRFLVRATDPLLVPLRRIIPPLGMFDLSPIVAFLLIWLFQSAIAGTLLRESGRLIVN